MPWTHVICEGQPGCPGKVIIALNGEHSELVIFSEEDGMLRTFPCSMPALLGVQRGTRTHLASSFGECMLSKEADGVWITVKPEDGQSMHFFLAPHEYLLALTRLVEAKSLQRRVTLK
ncbi:MAG: hypothetical protein QOJ65_163 [Fimbriimonadaceae bacterium]|nr:hypothetical protein [Fimbriimonadaceae bacterium]